MGYPLWTLDHLESWQVSWNMIDMSTQMGQPLWVFSPPQISRRWEWQNCTILQSTHYLCRQFFNENIYKSTKLFVGIWSISYLSSTWLYIWHLATLGRAGWNNNILWGSKHKKQQRKQIYWKGHLTAVMTMLMKYFYQEQVRWDHRARQTDIGRQPMILNQNSRYQQSWKINLNSCKVSFCA